MGAICKPARTGERTLLHQDEGYYDPAFDYRCARVMVWLPLVDVDAAGGCMHFVAGVSAPTPPPCLSFCDSKSLVPA